jgi:DNA (cytosine-5)-methyltransferase 1
MADEAGSDIQDYQGGTSAPWYEGWEITEERREVFRQTSRRSREAKLKAAASEGVEPIHPINVPALDPADLMPSVAPHGLASLSLFSGGGGLDLGFDRAGFGHVASYDTLEAAGTTLSNNRPEWAVYAGSNGDVRSIDWSSRRGEAAVLHGGPPCQPFSLAGRQRGADDERNLFPAFVEAVLKVRPSAFVAENVPALASPKFADYLRQAFYEPLARAYHVETFRLSVHDFGVPQVRQRVFFVGFRNKRALARFVQPTPTHRADHLGVKPASKAESAERTPGARQALGLSDLGFDALAPTLRSTLTGPRHTTSILSSVSAQKRWAKLCIWPNGVGATREAARGFPTPNGHFRLSVPDCALLQGFPASWEFEGAVYMALGQIGNSVAPPVSYRLALAVAAALHGRSWTPFPR